MPGIPLPKRSHEGPATSLGSSFQRSIGRVNVSPPCPSSFAYVTLFSNDAYLPGAIALQRSARAVGLQHPLIVICTQAVSQSSLKALAREGCQLRHVQPFQTPGGWQSGCIAPLFFKAFCAAL